MIEYGPSKLVGAEAVTSSVSGACPWLAAHGTQHHRQAEAHGIKLIKEGFSEGPSHCLPCTGTVDARALGAAQARSVLDGRAPSAPSLSAAVLGLPVTGARSAPRLRPWRPWASIPAAAVPGAAPGVAAATPPPRSPPRAPGPPRPWTASSLQTTPLAL